MSVSHPDSIEQRAKAALEEGSDVETLRTLAREVTATSASLAEQLLRVAVALVPDFIAAHVDLASLLCRLERSDEAIALLDDVAKHFPDQVWALSIRAAVLSAERRAEEALAAHQAVVACAPHAVLPWQNYALALKAIGATEEAIAAYRKALEIDPGNGSSWWGLANLRTIRFTAREVASMEKALGEGRHDLLQSIHLHFALGKGLGDVGLHEKSLQYYVEANRLRGQLAPYDADSVSAFCDRSRALFTADFFAERSASGCDVGDAIFIIGMPRSGSTLVEQILASHPMVEGTGELFEFHDLARQILSRGVAKPNMPDAFSALSGDELRRFGERYIRSTRRYRRTDRPLFTDKMPSNWCLVPLIHLALPNAKIIDVRRDPLTCCLSTFATFFNSQTSFPATLHDLARYHSDYVRLMSHMDACLPGRVHRVDYEKLVEDVETETRRLLAYIGLPFDSACLRFYENTRAIHTPSAQQVRAPIDRAGLERWRDYEPFLDPLKSALDDCTPGMGGLLGAERG